MTQSLMMDYWLRNAQLLRRTPTGSPLPPVYPTPTVPPGVTVLEYSVNPGETFAQAIVRLTTNQAAIVHVPAGLYELIDFDPNNSYSLYAPNCLGLIGDGVDKTIIQMRPNSSTQVAKVPVQSTHGSNPLTLVRLSKNHVLSMGFTLSGTDQPIDPNTGKPHTYSGWLNYVTTNSQLADIKITGIPGDWDAPPGETFANNFYKDTNTICTRIEVDGYQWIWSDATHKTKGNQVGGSPSGRNNSHNYKEYGCYYHDSYVSGFTSSFAGVPTDINATTNGVSTDHLVIANNANHTFVSGKTFPGVNHENVYGPIRHNAPNITMASYAQWDVAHMVFDSRLGDNPDIIITDPVWSGSYSKFNGMFTIKTGINYAGVPNTQTTPPTVILHDINGNPVTLTPHRYTANPSTLQNFDPALHYAWISG